MKAEPGWYVRITLPHGEQIHINEFISEAEALTWIEDTSREQSCALQGQPGEGRARLSPRFLAKTGKFRISSGGRLRLSRGAACAHAIPNPISRWFGPRPSGMERQRTKRRGRRRACGRHGLAASRRHNSGARSEWPGGSFRDQGRHFKGNGASALMGTNRSCLIVWRA
jgi:hypothetical protein